MKVNKNKITSIENLQYKDIFIKIEDLLKKKGKVLVAIDGMSGSGKTTLSKLLKDTYDCNLFHMDDYFLTPELKTKERLEEIGGNVDYVRFNKEVISGIKSESEFIYNIYNCKVQEITKQVSIIPKKLNVIEGAYSMHPTLINNYDLKIFLKIDSEQQRQNILKRNGKVMHKQFIDKWIPLENEYFDAFKIEEQSDVVIEVSFSHLP